MKSYFEIQYNGSAFSGSQEQRGEPYIPTVQGQLWRAAEALGLKAGLARIHLASRTDAGVHALGQVAELNYTPSTLDALPNVARSFNAVLPATLRVSQHQPAHGHPLINLQSEALAKWYRYSWYLSPRPNALLPPNVYASHTPAPSQVACVEEALQGFLGEHDFSSFRSAKKGVESPLCHLYYVGFWQENAEKFHLDVVGNRFLYKMVRNMAAYVQCLWQNEMKFHLPQQVLQAKSRQAFPRTAPSQGLTLMSILYPYLPLQFAGERSRALLQAYQKEFVHVQNIFCKTY